MVLSGVQILTLLVIGFSVFAAALLLASYLFFFQNMQKTWVSRLTCTALLVALTGLQWYHFSHLLFDTTDLLAHRPYVVLMLIAPPTFYFFSREVLMPDAGWSAWQLLHLAPLVLGLFLPVDIVAPLAFVIGAGYSVFGNNRIINSFNATIFFLD